MAEILESGKSLLVILAVAVALILIVAFWPEIIAALSSIIGIAVIAAGVVIGIIVLIKGK